MAAKMFMVLAIATSTFFIGLSVIAVIALFSDINNLYNTVMDEITDFKVFLSNFDK